MSLKTIIFDADHTLYTPESDEAYDAKFRFLAENTGKSEEMLRRAWEYAQKQKLQSRDPGEWERKARITEMLKAVGAQADQDLVDDAYSLFWETVADNTTHPTGVVPLLRTLRNHGYNIVLATDEFPEPLRMKLGTVLRTRDIESFFDLIITCQDIGKQKPSRKYYEQVTSKMSVLADECMMVGDSWVRDLAPAKKMGMITVLVGESDPHGDPDFQIETVTDLETVIEEVDER